MNPLPIQRVPPPWGGELGAEPGFKDLWKWRRTRRPEPASWHVPVDPQRMDLSRAPASGIRATWAGHSSLVLQVDGLTFLCDPVWSRRLAGGLVVPRKTPVGLPWEEVPRPNALLVSHDHYDHLDAPTIQRIARETPVVCGLGVGPWFRARGFSRVSQLNWWDEARVGSHRVTFVPAQHFSGRTLWGRDRTLWGGFVVEGPEGSVAYYAGDSGSFAGFREIGERFPRIDLCMMPIGAYEPRWFMSPVHVDPPEGGQAFLDCGARVMLPVHWGTFRLADEAIDEPPRVLKAWWKEKGLDPARLRIPALGGSVEVHAP